MILTKAPYRVSLFGGGSDHPEFFLPNEGEVLGFAIQSSCYVCLTRLVPGVHPFKYRVIYAKVEDHECVDDIEHPAVRGCYKYVGLDTPTELTHLGDLPARGGLGASSSFVVALLAALQTLRGASRVNQIQLADEAIYVEREVIREAVGFQDQIFAALGGFRRVTFRWPEWVAEPIILDHWKRDELQASLALVYTGTLRNTHEMAARQVRSIPDKTQYFDELVYLTRMAYTKLTGDRHIWHIGRMLDDAWKAKRMICDGITSPAIDDLYMRGRACGALGGKLLGSGGGGFVLFWVPPHRREYFDANIGAPVLPVQISDEGCRVLIRDGV